MGAVTTIGVDIAKSVFQAHGIDATGEVVFRRRLTRARVVPFFAKLAGCLIGMEACATSHYWARELIKLGHDVRLMPPSYVVREASEEKHGRCRSDLLGGDQTDDAIRGGEVT